MAWLFEAKKRYGLCVLELMPYFDSEPVMSNAFHEALVEAGVDNMDAYDCILRSEDGTVEYKGFKAVNIIGVIRATGEGTEFSGDPRLIDASMDRVVIDPKKTFGALMFRLAENLSTVVVHESVKRYIENKGFPSIVFRDPGDTLVLSRFSRVGPTQPLESKSNDISIGILSRL